MDRINFLKEKANLLRQDVIRMLAVATSGHPGGSLSSADILACLYFNELHHNPEDPEWEDRDRFILSKGHACPLLYSALARSGYFPPEELQTLRKINSRLQGHPDCKKTPGVEICTGSLGQGISVAVGMALAGKIDKKRYRVYVLLGDGEIEEWTDYMESGKKCFVEHLWEEAGNYNIKVTAKNEYGAKSSAYLKIKIEEKPLMQLIYPKGGENLKGLVNILWNITGENITIKCFNGEEWYVIAENISNTGNFLWNTRNYTNGKYFLKIEVYENGKLINEIQTDYFYIKNGGKIPSFSILLTLVSFIWPTIKRARRDSNPRPAA